MGTVEDIDAAVAAIDDYLNNPVPAPEHIMNAWRVVRGAARRERTRSSTSMPAVSALEAATASREHAEAAMARLDRKK